jgi:hypothetical protein
VEPLRAFNEVAGVASDLERLGLNPVLVLLGSQRVTQGFDFVVTRPGAQIDRVVDVFYRRGLELVSRLGTTGEVTATIDNRKAALLRLRLDAPASAFFFNPKTFLRVDLLFDFPIAAADLAINAVATKIRGRVLSVASAADLLRLKEIAAGKRQFAGDAQDVEFLAKLARNPAPGFTPETS